MVRSELWSAPESLLADFKMVWSKWSPEDVKPKPQATTSPASQAKMLLQTTTAQALLTKYKSAEASHTRSSFFRRLKVSGLLPKLIGIGA